MGNRVHFDAKRSLLLNYLPAAEAHGAQVLPLHEVQTLAPSWLDGYTYAAAYTVLDPTDYTCTLQIGTIHAKVVVLAAGAVGTPVILQRSALALGGIPQAVGRYFSGNGDRVSVAVVDETKASTLLGLSRPNGSTYAALPIGKPITTATYDYLNPAAPEFTRFTLQQIYFPPITNVLAQTTPGPGWFGITKREQRRSWPSWLTLLAMTEDDNEGTFGPPPPTGGFTRLAAGIGLGTMAYTPTPNTLNGWNTADTALRTILEQDGLATVQPWTDQIGGQVTAHPLGSCRIGDEPTTSALTDSHELRRHPGLFVTDGAAVPTSLTVNPSLTIAALAERAVPAIIDRAGQLGLNLTPGPPPPSS